MSLFFSLSVFGFLGRRRRRRRRRSHRCTRTGQVTRYKLWEDPQQRQAVTCPVSYHHQLNVG